MKPKEQENQFDFERWVDGNRVYLYHTGEDYVNKIESSFDLAHLSAPNPRQFEGLGSKNLLLLDIYTIFNTYEHVWQRVYHADSYYLFDVQGRVSRKIIVYTSYGEGDLPLAGGQPNYTNVTDYKYACP